MKDVKGADSPDLTATATFRLGTVGAYVTDAYTARIDALGFGLRPKHVGLMTVLAAEGPGRSQQDLARGLGVAPSLVVALADHLEGLGAVRRERDPADRRRQLLTLTDEGRALLARCAAIGHELDEELLDGVPRADRERLHAVLAALAGRFGLPG
ncbi:MarR family winged helix-turn-helix transcriptional regulator [Yinghuangia seranimata]|uniref:MarR family winged helix-turn-helix transcriptional regulator n=1 Tax=Yinghuangia seranimata TaxID=408067 RepID=UPI00248C1198|nr:MarR family transcriptional regulator [Yinghuangia seranimata]MDI2130298.1 MarR family transcriptional regulator [Yinghuangia seranimata]